MRSSKPRLRAGAFRGREQIKTGFEQLEPSSRPYPLPKSPLGIMYVDDD
jgi:hypothetical protein